MTPNRPKEPVVMIEELVNRFRFYELADGGALIIIEVPKDYANLWLHKVNELRAAPDELEYWGSSERGSS